MIELPLAVTALLTVLSPYITAFFNRVNWSSETKNLVSLSVSIVISVLYLLMTGGIADWSQLGIVIPAVYGLSQLVYQFLLKVSASKFEAATTKGAVIVSPVPDSGTVNITTEESIKAGTEPVTAHPPVEIAPTPTEIVTTTPAKG
ncbi:membrane protein [Arthrobacter phage Racecar]|nr:hypothetical protein PBI_RACECAR_137 [Arthrobacter phage Racecar]QFG12811.1 hypothetical protein PBI_MIMI_134 [Arthrobacter phage Mimi]